MSARDLLLATSASQGDGKYERSCWMCDGGRLRIFVDPDDKVLIDHSEPACRGWVASKLLADEYLADLRRANPR